MQCCFLEMLSSTNSAAPMPQLTALLDEKELQDFSIVLRFVGTV